MNLDEYLSLDATSLAGLVAKKEVTPHELLALAKRRADAVNPKINAIVMRLDRQADDQLARGVSGPFAGVPFLLKDLAQEYAGTPTSAGSRSLRGYVATEHSLVTQRFLDAGLVVFGKTNTPELGAKGVTEPEFWGPARSPWDLSRTPGGSSGGSAAAVAARIVPAAGANDGGGSIRIPAACSGLVGLKLSRGLTPFGPQTGELLFGMVTQGVVSRTVRDTAGLLDVMLGDSDESDYLGRLPERSFLSSIEAPPKKLRIGMSAQSAINPNPHPESVRAMHRAAKVLAELGHEVEEVAPPCDDAALARDFLTIWFSQLNAQVFAIKEQVGAVDGDFEADTLALAEVGRAAGLGPFGMALGHVHEHVRALAKFHRSFDLLLTPTLASPPPVVGSMRTPKVLQWAARCIPLLHAGRLVAWTGIVDQLVSKNLGWVPYTQLANLTGRPAITVPLHMTEAGLPLGVQFVGRLGSDGELLALAKQLEDAVPWAERQPRGLAS